MLSQRTEVTVRFNEVDPLGIVWHGNYLRYFEDGREAFGKVYGISYLDFQANGLAVPIVSVQCDYKRPLKYGDNVIVETLYKPQAAAKLSFAYTAYHAQSMEVVATGSSVQVFVGLTSFELQLTVPEFFENWKRKWDV